MKRSATAHWEGTGKEGTGILNTPGSALNNTPYSFLSRFVNKDNVAETNPEELIAAAHAGCFSMKLAFNLNAAGFTAETITTTCTIVLEEGTITESHLAVLAKVPEISQDQFEVALHDAEHNCPVSKLLKAKISVTFTLE